MKCLMEVSDKVYFTSSFYPTSTFLPSPHSILIYLFLFLFPSPFFKIHPVSVWIKEKLSCIRDPKVLKLLTLSENLSLCLYIFLTIQLQHRGLFYICKEQKIKSLYNPKCSMDQTFQNVRTLPHLGRDLSSPLLEI